MNMLMTLHWDEIAVNEDLYQWSSELKLELNPGKTKTAFFTTNRHNFKNIPKRDLNGVQLRKESNPVYLGITELVSELRYRSHISDSEAKSTMKLNVMRSIAGREQGRISVLFENDISSYRDRDVILSTVYQFGYMQQNPIWTSLTTGAQYAAGRIITETTRSDHLRLTSTQIWLRDMSSTKFYKI